MIFLYEEGKSGLRITRVFGREGSVEIPESIGNCPVTELGAYVFSDKMDRKELSGLLANGRLCREDGTLADNGERLPELAGEAVQELVLPDKIVKIGRYAFYNCGNLEKISFGGNLWDIGAGALTGCHKIKQLSVEVSKDGTSCLRELLTELPEELCVELKWNGEEGRFWFPEFFEEGVENTPARILENHVHGSGLRYRNCFVHRSLHIKEYDKLFAYARAWENERTVMALAMDRILYPMELSEKAKKGYLDYVKEHLLEGVFLLAKRNEYGAVGKILEEILPDRDAVDEMLERAEREENMECVSVLMDYLHRHTRKRRKVFEL